MHFATPTSIAVLLAATALLSCKKGSESRGDPLDDAPVLKIWVWAACDIEVNGQPAGIDEAGKALDDIAKQNGVVWYGREASTSEPHPIASKVFQLILDHR